MPRIHIIVHHTGKVVYIKHAPKPLTFGIKFCVELTCLIANLTTHIVKAVDIGYRFDHHAHQLKLMVLALNP